MMLVPTKQKFEEYEKLGLVRSQVHPHLPLKIFVYSDYTTYERLWNNVTMQARGIVFDHKGRCVVRCMPKFFNDSEPHATCAIDHSKLIFQDKMDGSLIQVVNDPEYGLIVTSKGSFASDQARWARDIIDANYTPDDFNQGCLLAVINNQSGHEDDIYHEAYAAFSRVPIVSDVEVHMGGDLIEGVVAYDGKNRYKIKTGEYLRLHRILTETNAVDVWEILAVENMAQSYPGLTAKEIGDRIGTIDKTKIQDILDQNGKAMDRIIEKMPDEFYHWLHVLIGILQDEVSKLASDTALAILSTDTSDRAAVAKRYAHDTKMRAMIFATLDGRTDIALGLAWRYVKPEATKAFTTDTLNKEKI